MGIKYTVRRHTHVEAPPREIGEVTLGSWDRGRKDLREKLGELQRLRGLPRGSVRKHILKRVIRGTDA